MANLTPNYSFLYLQQGDVLYPGFDYENMLIAENQLEFAFKFFGPCVGSGWTAEKLSTIRGDQLLLLGSYINDPYSEYGQKLAKMNLGFSNDYICNAATTSNITLSGGAPNTLDGITLSSSSKILVKDQTDKKQNGVYAVSSLGTGSNGTWARAGILNTSSDFSNNFVVYVEGGTANTSTLWIGSSLGNTFGNIDLYFDDVFKQCVKVYPGNGIVDIYYGKTEMPHYFRYRFVDDHYLWAEKTLNLPYNNICKISSPTPPNIRYGKDSNSAYLATVVSGMGSTLYDLPIVEDIIYGPLRVNYSDLNSDFQNKIKDKFLRHRHLGEVSTPTKINLSTHISLFAKPEYSGSSYLYSPILILKNSDNTNFVGNFDNYGIPLVYVNNRLLGDTEYRFVLNSTPCKIILKNSVDENATVEIVLPLFTQKSLFCIDNNGNKLTSSISPNTRKFLTDGTTEDRTPNDNNVNLVYKNFNWSNTYYLDAIVKANGNIVEKKYYTINPDNGTISFSSSWPDIASYNFDDIKIIIDQTKAEIKSNLPSQKQENINASSFSRGSIGSTNIYNLSHNYFSKYLVPAEYTFDKTLISGFASSIFYPSNTSSDLQFNTKLRKIYQSVNFDTNEIIYLSDAGLMYSDNTFKNISIVDSWTTDYGVPNDFKDDIINSSGENIFNRSLVSTTDGEIFYKDALSNQWEKIDLPVNSLNENYSVNCFDISTDKVENNNSYDYSSYLYIGTDDGLFSANITNNEINNEIDYYQTEFYNSGSLIEISNIQDITEISSENIQYLNGLPDEIKIDRNLYVVSNDVTYPGLYVGTDYLVERKISGSFKGTSWINAGTQNENLNNLIWWDDYDVYITHSANYYETENNSYWDHPFTIDAGSYSDCVCATTANITLTGTQTIDGYSTSVGERVLVKNQDDPTENGIYLVSAGSWSRATDLDQNSEFVYGKTVSITNGTLQSSSIWYLKYSSSYALGTTDILWDIYKLKIYSTSTPTYTATRSIVKDVIVRKSNLNTNYYIIVHTDGFALITEGSIITDDDMVWEAPYQGNVNSAFSYSNSSANGLLFAASDYGLYTSTEYFWTPKDQITDFSIEKSAWNRTENFFIKSDILKIIDSNSGTALTGFTQYPQWQMIEFDSAKSIGLLMNYEREFKNFKITPWKYDFLNDDETSREYNLAVYINGKPSQVPFTTNSETGEINFVNSVGSDNYENVKVNISSNNPFFTNNGVRTHEEIFAPAYKISQNSTLFYANSITNNKLYLNQTIDSDLKLLLLEYQNTKEIVYVKQIDNYVDPPEVTLYFSRDQYGSNFEFPEGTLVYTIENALTDNIQDDLYYLLSKEKYNLGSLNNANVGQMVLALQDKYSTLYDVEPAPVVSQTDTRGLKNLEFTNDLINDAIYDSTNSSAREYLGIPDIEKHKSYKSTNVIDVSNLSKAGSNLIACTDNGVWIYKSDKWLNLYEDKSLICKFIKKLNDNSFIVGTDQGLFNISSSYVISKNESFNQSVNDFDFGFFDNLKYQAYAKSDGALINLNYDDDLSFTTTFLSSLDGVFTNKVNKITHTRISSNLFANYDVLYFSSRQGLYAACISNADDVFSSNISHRKIIQSDPEGVSNYFGAFVANQIPTVPVNNNLNNNLFILTNDGILKADNYRWVDPSVSNGASLNISKRFLRGLNCNCFVLNKSDSSNSTIYPGKSKIFIGTNKGVYRSLDGGEYFERTNRFNKKFASINNLQYFSSSFVSGASTITKDVLVASSNLGLWYSIDDGDNWYKCGEATDDSEFPVLFDYYPSNQIAFTNSISSAKPLGQSFVAPDSGVTIEKIALKLHINKDLIDEEKYSVSLAGNTVAVKLYGVASNLPDDGGTLLATSSSINISNLIENDETVFTISYAASSNQNLSFVINETLVAGGISLLKLERSSIANEYGLGNGFDKYSGSWTALTDGNNSYSFYFKIYYNSNSTPTETNVGIGNYNDTDINWDLGKYKGCIVTESGDLKLDNRFLLALVIDDTNSMSKALDNSDYVTKFKNFIDALYDRTARTISGSSFNLTATQFYEINDDVQKFTSDYPSINKTTISNYIADLNQVGNSQKLFDGVDEAINVLYQDTIFQLYYNNSNSFDSLLTYLDDDNYLRLSTLVTDYNNLTEDDGWDETKLDIPNSELASKLLLNKFAGSYVPICIILTDGENNSQSTLQYLKELSLQNWNELGFKYVVFNLGKDGSQVSLNDLVLENNGYHFTIDNDTEWDNATNSLLHGGSNSLFKGEWNRLYSYNEKKFVKSINTTYTVSSGQTVDSACVVKFRYSEDFINFSNWITLTSGTAYTLNKFITDIEYQIDMTEGWTGSAVIAPYVSQLYHTEVSPSTIYLYSDPITTDGYINEYLLTTNAEHFENVEIDWAISRVDSTNWNKYEKIITNRYSVLNQRQKTYNKSSAVSYSNLTLQQYGDDLYKFYVINNSSIFTWADNYTISVYSNGTLIPPSNFRVDNNTGIIVFDSEISSYTAYTIDIVELENVYVMYGESTTTTDNKVYYAKNGPWLDDDNIAVLVNNEIQRSNYNLNNSNGSIVFKKTLSSNDVVTLFVKHPSKFRIGMKIKNYNSSFTDKYKFALQYTTLKNLNKVEEKNATSKPYIIDNRIKLISQIKTDNSTLSTNYPISLDYIFGSDFSTEEAESNITWLSNNGGIASFLEIESSPNYTGRMIQQNEDLNESVAVFQDTDEVYVKVQPRDEYKFGAVYTSEVYTLEDFKAPYVYDLKIRLGSIIVNNQINAGSQLTATYTFISNVTPTNDSSTVNWYDYSSGSKTLLYTGIILPSSYVLQGKVLSFEVIPYNGVSYGTTLESNLIIVV